MSLIGCVAQVTKRRHIPAVNWVRHYLTRTGKPDAWLAAQLGEHRQTVSKMLKRPEVSQKWADRIAPILTMALGTEVTPINLMHGPGTTAPSDLPSPDRVVLVPVRGEAAAGLWREVGWESDVTVPIPAHPGRWPTDKQYAYKISGPSAELLGIRDGDFAICVPYDFARSQPLDKDVVIVERHRDGLIEITCKELRITADAIELWPRTNDPRYQQPIRLVNGAPPDEFTSYKIAGLVIALHRPMA